jgi:hypothetical protein
MKTRLLLTTVSALLAVGIALRMGAELGGERAAIPAPSAVAETTQTGQPLPVQNASVEQANLSTAVLPAEAPLGQVTNASDILQRLNAETQWSQRSAVAKELRSLSDPGELSVLLPALMENYGRGNTIFNEISDAIARLAQAETVEMLEFMHWEASTQAGQGRKILRTIAAIRNPPARRALAKLASNTQSPALAACAVEALKAMDGAPVAASTSP